MRSVRTALQRCRAPGDPVILSSLPGLTPGPGAYPGLSFVNAPPGRSISMAIGMAAAMPSSPLVLVMNADSVTLGTNHLIHAARRNIGMTLLLLREELTTSARYARSGRLAWVMPDLQQSLEKRGTPLEWASALEAAFVGRGSVADPDQLAGIIRQAIDTPGFSVVGVTGSAELPLGVLSRNAWPEYFAAYRDWTAPFVRAGKNRPAPAARTEPATEVPRFEIRVAGLGGHGIKLAGAILSEAAGMHEGLFATHIGDYGSATRGGPSRVDIVIGSQPVSYPGATRPDVLVALTRESAERYAGQVSDRGFVLVDSEAVPVAPADAGTLPIVGIAREFAGKPVAAGVVALGCIAAITDRVAIESIQKSLRSKVPPHTLDGNLAALYAGYQRTGELLGR